MRPIQDSRTAINDRFGNSSQAVTPRRGRFTGRYFAALAVTIAAMAFAMFSPKVGHCRDVSEWRTEVQVSNGGNGPPLTFGFDGGLNDPSSSVSLSGGGATAQASSELSSGGYIPTLRTFAGNSGKRAQAVAWGVQGYTNTSATALTTSLLLDLDGEVSGSNSLRASVYLFETGNFEFFKDTGTILFESSSELWEGFDPGAFDVAFSGDTGGPINEARSFEFTVQPGEGFYVWAQLRSTASNSGFSDASSTLTASLTNTTGLVPASIPEPGALALLFGYGALCCVRRRRPRGVSLPERSNGDSDGL